MREDLDQLVARDPHELMRALETQSILDCADLAAAASLYRTESRWGLYHLRVDYPETDNDNWFCHSMHYKDAMGRIAHRKRAGRPLYRAGRRGRDVRLSPSAHQDAGRGGVEEPTMPIANHATSVPVVVDDDKCIAHKGCTVCVEVCPLDVLAIDETRARPT